VTGTKQFVWSNLNRCEERDGTGSLTKKFFVKGQVNGATKLFYSKNSLGSIVEVTDNSGILSWSAKFDPFGQVVVSNSTNVDFQFAGMYFHERSKLNLTLHRAYLSSLGRWISRDPLGATDGTNVYDYVGNNPVSMTDELGLFKDIREVNGTIVITIPITFWSNEKMDQGTMDQYIQGINTYWNPGNLTYKGKPVVVNAFIGKLNGQTNRIQLTCKRQQNLTFENHGIWSTSLSAELDAVKNSPGWSAAHEIGHTLGEIDHETGSTIMSQPRDYGRYASDVDIKNAIERP
jgi:RHS repeat-associated protein